MPIGWEAVNHQGSTVRWCDKIQDYPTQWDDWQETAWNEIANVLYHSIGPSWWWAFLVWTVLFSCSFHSRYDVWKCFLWFIFVISFLEKKLLHNAPLRNSEMTFNSGWKGTGRNNWNFKDFHTPKIFTHLSHTTIKTHLYTRIFSYSPLIFSNFTR